MTPCPHCLGGIALCKHGVKDPHALEMDRETGKITKWCDGGTECRVCAGTGRLPGT